MAEQRLGLANRLPEHVRLSKIRAGRSTDDRFLNGS